MFDSTSHEYSQQTLLETILQLTRAFINYGLKLQWRRPITKVIAQFSQHTKALDVIGDLFCFVYCPREVRPELDEAALKGRVVD